jgi:hypothetical protein
MRGVPETVWITRTSGGAWRWRVHNSRGESIQLTAAEMAEVLADLANFASEPRS